MGRMSAELLAAYANGDSVFTVAELDIGGGTELYAGNWVASDSLGLYKAQVVPNGFGNIKQGVSLQLGGLQAAGTSVTIRDDDDLTLHKMMEGEYGRTINGSDARIKIVSPAIDADQFYTAFTGEIGSVAQVQPRVWQFQIRPKDKPLRGVVRTPIISSADWPNADGDAVGQRAPIVFGKHESTGTTAAGMVPTLYVDTSGYRYLFSVSAVDGVNDVFVDGVSTGSGWTYTGPLINGRKYSTIDFVSDQGDSVITVDVDGVTGSGYGGGDVETNPANQLLILLVNFIFDEYQTGAWLDSSVDCPQIDYSSFQRTAAWFDIHNTTGSCVIQGGAQIGAIITEWADTFQCAVYWTNDGKIGVAPDPYILDDIYFSSPWLNEDHCLADPKYTYSTELLKDEVQANFLYSETDGKAFDSVRVKDTLRGYDVAESTDLKWGISSII